MRMMPNSLVAQALLLGMINAAAVLALGFLTMENAYHVGLVDFFEAPVQERILVTSRTISVDLIENDSRSWNALLTSEAKGTPFQFALFNYQGKQIAGVPMDIPAVVQKFSSNVTPKLSIYPKFETDERPEHKYTPPDFLLQRDPKTGIYWAGVHVLMRDTNDDMYGHGTLIWRFSSLWTNPYFFNSWPYITMVLGTMMITGLCWFPAVRVLLRRISKLTYATRQIAKGDFDVALPASASDEIGQLTESVALMSRQIAGLLKQQERFVSDAAHELCSPISRLQMALELLRTSREANGLAGIKSEAGNGSHTNYFSDIAEEIEQMSELIDDLLFYSRARNQKLPVKSQPVALAAAIRSVIAREGLAEGDVIVNVPETLCMQASEPHLRRALANLLRNARQYAGEAGKVEVFAHEDGTGVHVLIRDQGPGIPEEELTQVFAPFYRVEHARSRHTGGTGLGLAIVQSSVEACGGTVSCRNRRPTGLEVELVLPSA